MWKVHAVYPGGQWGAPRGRPSPALHIPPTIWHHLEGPLQAAIAGVEGDTITHFQPFPPPASISHGPWSSHISERSLQSKAHHASWFLTAGNLGRILGVGSPLECQAPVLTAILAPELGWPASSISG